VADELTGDDRRLSMSFDETRAEEMGARDGREEDRRLPGEVGERAEDKRHVA